MEYKIEELRSDVVLQYKPSEKVIQTTNRVYQRFRDMQTERDRARREFDWRTLEEYVNDSMDSYNGIVSEEIKATKEDWQSTIWDHETRGKLKTMVSMIVGTRPYVSFYGETEEDDDSSEDLFDVYEDSWKKENGSYKMYQQVLSAACKGTVIVEESYVEEYQTIKEIQSINQETGVISYTEKRVIKDGAGHVEANIVPLLQFYPNENSAEIKHDCCVVKQYSMKAFKNKFGKYPNAKYVVAGIWGSDVDNIEYKSLTSRIADTVEVIRYYNEDFDEFIVLANGVWINPQKGDEPSPMPYDHKRLPFAKTVFELADEECFYGKSFPDLMKGEQDTRNALIRLMIDQEVLAINKPIITGMGIEIDSNQLYPGAMKKFNGDISQVRELPMSGATQTSFQLLQMLKQSNDINTSVSPIAQGVGSSRKTAREAVILDENAKRISGTFQVFIYKLLYDRATLRLSNIQQFYTQPVQYPTIKDEYGKELKTSEGKTFEGQPEYRKVPVFEDGKQPRWITMTPEMRRAKLRVRLEEDFEVAMNRSSRIELSKALLDESKTNPLMNADNCTIDYLKALGKHPDRYYIKPTPEAQQFAQNNTVPAENPQGMGMQQGMQQ